MNEQQNKWIHPVLHLRMNWCNEWAGKMNESTLSYIYVWTGTMNEQQNEWIHPAL